jgi:hypothetical protein
MASAVQERCQAPTDGSGRAGKEDPVTHHGYSFVTMRQTGVARSFISTDLNWNR